MGTPEFAVYSLEALINAGHDVCLVVTQPDKPVGRKAVLSPPPVKVAAQNHGIEVYQPRRMRDAEAIAYLEKFNPDLIVVASYGQILPKEVIEMAKFGCINVHASLLPQYRGASPIQWAIMDGNKETGVTIMQVVFELDAGDIISQVRVPIEDDDIADTLFVKLADAGAKLLTETVVSIENGTAVYTKQDLDKVSYVSMIKKEDGHLDLNMSAKQLWCRIRGLNSWPVGFVMWEDKPLKFWTATYLEKNSEYKPGEVCGFEKNALLIQTGDGILSVSEIQAPGKKRMPAGDFLRGARMEPGTLLK